MTSHLFLSDEWIAAARGLKADHAGDPTDQPGLVVNATVTRVPFGSGTLTLTSDHGPLIGWAPGHAAAADFELVIDYEVARDLVLDRSPNGLELALAAGDIDVVGDFGAFRDWWHSRIDDPATAELERHIREITA